MTWLDKLDIEAAIKEIQTEERRGKDFCLDPLRFEDLSIKEVRKSLIEKIVKDLKDNKYQPGKLIEIDVPKSNFTLRPAARPNLIDWIIYTAIVNFIGDTIHQKIPKNSFSFNRFRDKKKKTKKKSIDYWLEFENEAIALSKDDKFEYLLTTDITAFFEHISIDELNNRLKFLSNDTSYEKAVNYLTTNLLGKWTEDNKIPKFGLPQGPTASIILADIYLYAIDKSVNDEKNFKFLRYMDDFRLFARNKVELKKGISLLVRKMRELKLNLNAKKTTNYLLSNKGLLETVFDPNRDLLNLIDTAFRSEKKDQILLVVPYLLKLKDATNPTFNERYFKFFIGKIIDSMKLGLVKKTYIDELTSELLGVFKEKHHLSNTLCWFFIAAGNYSKDISKKIIEELIKFICSKENIYEWQEMWALDTIRQLGTLNNAQLKKIQNKYNNKNDMCFGQFALIAGKSGNHDAKEHILNLGRIESDQYRSTLLALQDIDRNMLKKIQSKAPEYYLKYINNLKGKRYGFKYDLRRNTLTEIVTEY